MSSNDTATANAAATNSTDARRCRLWLPRVSRTFALSIELLPVSLQDAVRLAYLLCRIVDTIEDEPAMPGAERDALFDLFDRALDDDDADVGAFERQARQHRLGSGADAELCAGANSVFRGFRDLPPAQRAAIRPSVQEMSAGMREYCRRADAEGRLRLRDLEDLERYCYYVAGTVGALLTALFSQTVSVQAEERRRAIEQRSLSFGLGLQLVNIVKDVATDWRRGDCFLPHELAEAHGLDLEHLLDPAHRQAALAVIASVCERAREHLERAREYTLTWPTPQADHVRLFCAIPLTLAFASLHEVTSGEDTLRPDRVPKIGRAAVSAIVTQIRGAISSDAALAQVLDSWANDPGEALNGSVCQ